MKPIFITLTLLLSYFSLAQSDSATFDKKIKIGVKGGLNVAYIPEVLEEVKENTPVIGLHVGTFLRVPLKEKWYLQAEAYYSLQGTNTLFFVRTDIGGLGNVEFDLHADFKFTYINVPVVLRWNVYKDFYIGAGPYIGFQMYDNVKVYAPDDNPIQINPTQGSISEVSDVLLAQGYTFDLVSNKTDFGIDFDGGYTHTFDNKNTITLNGRYQLGIEKLLEGKEKDTEGAARNSVFSLGLEYSF